MCGGYSHNHNDSGKATKKQVEQSKEDAKKLKSTDKQKAKAKEVA